MHLQMVKMVKMVDFMERVFYHDQLDDVSVGVESADVAQCPAGG